MAPDRLPEPLGVALAVARELEHLDISYVAVGSLASSVHGEPRSTDDLDFLVDLRRDRASRFSDPGRKPGVNQPSGIGGPCSFPLSGTERGQGVRTLDADPKLT